jgi:hypothetical protein
VSVVYDPENPIQAPTGMNKRMWGASMGVGQQVSPFLFLFSMFFLFLQPRH